MKVLADMLPSIMGKVSAMMPAITEVGIYSPKSFLIAGMPPTCLASPPTPVRPRRHHRVPLVARLGRRLHGRARACEGVDLKIFARLRRAVCFGWAWCGGCGANSVYSQ